MVCPTKSLPREERLTIRLTEVQKMADRIITMRDKLYDALVKLETPGDWGHIKSQIGQFLMLKSKYEADLERDVLVYRLYVICLSAARVAGGICEITQLTSAVSPEQVAQLGEEAHIYLTKDGRISMAGLNDGNIQVSSDTRTFVSWS